MNSSKDTARQASGMLEKKSTGQKDVAGIVSIILAFTIFQVIGLVIGVIGIKSAKAAGRSSRISKIGVLMNIATMLFVVMGIIALAGLWVTGTPTKQEQEQNNVVVREVNILGGWLEEFHSANGFYPEDPNQLFSGKEKPEFLVDDAGESYSYQPDNCVDQKCSGFKISGKTLKTRSNYTLYNIN